MIWFTFYAWDRKYLFCQIWSKKSKLSVSVEIWYVDWVEYEESNGGVYFFLFLNVNTLFVEIWSKKSKLPVNTEIWYLDWFDSAESIGKFNFSVFNWKYLLLGKLSPKNQNCQLKLKCIVPRLIGV